MSTCFYYFVDIECAEGQMTCADSGCAWGDRCDGETNCRDDSDEENCNGTFKWHTKWKTFAIPRSPQRNHYFLNVHDFGFIFRTIYSSW